MNTEYSNLVDELEDIIRLTLSDLKSLLEPSDFDEIKHSVERIEFLEQPWLILEEIFKQLFKLIIQFQDREKVFEKELFNRKKLLNN